MATILGKEADILLQTIIGCGDQFQTGILYPEGAYAEALRKLRETYDDKTIFEGTKLMREVSEIPKIFEIEF